MMSDSEHEITDLLSAWRSGDSEAERVLLDKLYPLVRALAARHLSKPSDPITLQATELANEAFIKLYGQGQQHWENRQHFLAITGRILRRVVLDHLKSRGREKRGAGLVFVTLDNLDARVEETTGDLTDWVTVDALLTELELVDHESARLIELRYFAGLSVEEAAEVMGISVSTAVRDWRSARAWLHARLQ